MFETLKPQPADKILALMQMYREDPRADKIDLGVGVYKNAKGVTPPSSCYTVLLVSEAAVATFPTLSSFCLHS